MFPHVKTFLLAIAQTNSKRNLAKSHKITFTLFYFAFYIVREDVYGVGFAFVGAIFERMSIFSPNKTLLSTHLTLNCRNTFVSYGSSCIEAHKIQFGIPTKSCIFATSLL